MSKRFRALKERVVWISLTPFLSILEEAGMNHPRALGPAAAAGGAVAAGENLPVTGSSTLTFAIAGVLLVVMGLLLLRSARCRRTDA
jgi:LPXTG-motif cell wall-anchored protein